MPRQNKAQETGRSGERWFPQQLPANWIFQPPHEDVGVDGVVVICDDSPSNGLEFRVQIKSSELWRVEDEHVVVRVKRESLVYWLSGFSPTLLVLYEAASNTGWCTWINQIIAEDLSVLKGEAKMVSLRVPVAHRLDASIWKPLSRQLHSLNLRIAKRIIVAGAALPVLEATRWLMQSLHLIDLCANGRQEDSDDVPQTDLVLAEITAHKEIVAALLQLDGDLKDAGASIIGIKDLAQRYSDDCAKFIVNFPAFVRHSGPGFTTQVNLKALIDFRPEAMRVVTQVVGKLSAISLEVARDSRCTGGARSRT
ncbi:MAG TPA: DUF4365 domain-containing protein [Pyrinomonadaceae bacterium]|nr:DUF4365 domain-containing protein [Pyrinomonadaceae bacterium]